MIDWQKVCAMCITDYGAKPLTDVKKLLKKILDNQKSCRKKNGLEMFEKIVHK